MISIFVSTVTSFPFSSIIIAVVFVSDSSPSLSESLSSLSESLSLSPSLPLSDFLSSFESLSSLSKFESSLELLESSFELSLSESPPESPESSSPAITTGTLNKDINKIVIIFLMGKVSPKRQVSSVNPIGTAKNVAPTIALLKYFLCQI